MKDADDKMYCYSTSEPYYANRIFPLFDQPNLKNSFSLSVNAPEDWTIISNEARTGELETQPDKTVTWKFAPTPRLSTYLYCICAGPFLEIKCEDPLEGIPMSHFVRASLLNHLKV
jgi:aminopeptidase N